jgi:prepilin-type N-terminal cleavage/methylation domain-containing protein
MLSLTRSRLSNARILPLQRRRPFIRAGVTMIELLCVITIICILASLLLPAVFSAYSRVRGITDEWDVEDVAHMLRHEVRRYCAVHPQYQFDTKNGLADKCGVSPKCRAFLQKSRTEFVPFKYPDATNLVVVTFHVGPRYKTTYTLNKFELTITPPP